jgi:hypothetical protein
MEVLIGTSSINGGFSSHVSLLEDPNPVDRCPVAKWILHPLQRIHKLLGGNVRKTLSQLMIKPGLTKIHLATPRNYTNGHRKMWFGPPPKKN